MLILTLIYSIIVYLIGFLYKDGASPVCPPIIDSVYIVDFTGKVWNITYAVNFLGMDSAAFKHGSGPQTFPPILDPVFASPGDPDYPESNQDAVIGLTLNGENRAYRIADLLGHEVADDYISPSYIAVTF